ncbi:MULTISPECIES: YueI family protein [Bacillus]|uniref:YueI family protein n=1 Tax=Bacillus TaxID=1386 RepID=UPI000C788E9C|nr:MULTISPECIES: YueI family protein [Bacillus]PLR86480.1 DUF1694 domain-containing protein [Bacillus sp. V33-4]RSK47637.1 DUF1694 domain-containing protein [Bacillus canaveralius]
MPKSSVDDYIQQGIHGQKETKPDERRKFLGTLRERIVGVLTKQQIREAGIYEEAETLMKQNPNAHLYLNGDMDYADLSKYIKIAKKCRLEYTIVTNKEQDTEIGLVLAYSYAIDKEDIEIKQKVKPEHTTTNKKQGIFSFLNKVFKK